MDENDAPQNRSSDDAELSKSFDENVSVTILPIPITLCHINVYKIEYRIAFQSVILYNLPVLLLL